MLESGRMRRLVLLASLLAACGGRFQSPEQRLGRGPSGPGAAAEAPYSFADPGEEAPITDLALDAVSQHLVAVSRKGRRIGGAPVATGVWSWKYTLSFEPSVVAVHPATGEGALVWQKPGGAELVRFRPSTGETLETLELGKLEADQVRAAVFDTRRNHLLLAAEDRLLVVDWKANRVLSNRSPGARELAVDSSRGLAVVVRPRGEITMLELASGAEAVLGEAASAGGVAIDSEQGRAWVVTGREWVEIDLEARQVARRVAFDPERDFGGAGAAVATACGRLYLACGELVEVNLEDGRWSPIATLGGCPAPLAHLANLGALFTIQGGQIHSAYHHCEP